MKRIGAATSSHGSFFHARSSPFLLLLLTLLLMMVQQTTSFLLPSLPSSSHPVVKPLHHQRQQQHHHNQPLTREKEAVAPAASSLLAKSAKPQQPLYSTTSSGSSSSNSNSAGTSGEVTPSPSPSSSSSSQPAEPQIEFSDDWKTMVEEGIPIDLSAIFPDADTLSTKDGTVFLRAFNKNKDKGPNFLQRFLGRLGKKEKKVNQQQQINKGTDTNVREISARDWWRWTPEEQREFLEATTTNIIAPPPPPQPSPSSASEASPVSSSSSPPTVTTKPNSNSNDQAAPPPTIFLLRHRFPFSSLTSRVAYHPATGRFTLAETPLFEKTRLYTWWFPLIVRVLLPVARPLYAPFFCLKWLGLKFMIVWRSFSQFVWPSPPYVVLFSIRALYMLGACMLVTVALDELMQPVLEWIYKVVMKAAGKTGSGTVLPDLRFYSLDAAGRGKKGPSNWDERLWNL